MFKNSVSGVSRTVGLKKVASHGWLRWKVVLLLPGRPLLFSASSLRLVVIAGPARRREYRPGHQDDGEELER